VVQHGGTAGVIMLQTPEHDDQQCLTGTPQATGHGPGDEAASRDNALCADQGVPAEAAASSPRDWHQFETREELTAAADALFPLQGSISDNVRRALTVSQTWMDKSRARRGDPEQCPRGLGAPQGPLGEVYTTHTTVEGLTWRYVVGIQLTTAFNVTTSDLAINNSSTHGGGGHVSIRWSDADTFHPDTGAELHLLDSTHPLQLHNSTGLLCQTGAGVMDVVTECFPIQWHVIAPVLANGWVIIGETGKFIPISNQRISAIDINQQGVNLTLAGKVSSHIAPINVSHQFS